MIFLIVTLIALIAVFIAARFAYNAAIDTGRNGFLWAVATIGIGLGLQQIIPFFIGLIVGFVYVVSGNPVSDLENDIGTPLIIMNIVFMVLSFIGIWMILRYLSKIPEDGPDAQTPPPPPTFDQGV